MSGGENSVFIMRDFLQGQDLRVYSAKTNSVQAC